MISKENEKLLEALDDVCWLSNSDYYAVKNDPDAYKHGLVKNYGPMFLEKGWATLEKGYVFDEYHDLVTIKRLSLTPAGELKKQQLHRENYTWRTPEDFLEPDEKLILTYLKNNKKSFDTIGNIARENKIVYSYLTVTCDQLIDAGFVKQDIQSWHEDGYEDLEITDEGKKILRKNKTNRPMYKVSFATLGSHKLDVSRYPLYFAESEEHAVKIASEMIGRDLIDQHVSGGQKLKIYVNRDKRWYRLLPEPVKLSINHKENRDV